VVHEVNSVTGMYTYKYMCIELWTRRAKRRDVTVNTPELKSWLRHQLS
jgi:hypothetical protein